MIGKNSRCSVVIFPEGSKEDQPHVYDSAVYPDVPVYAKEREKKKFKIVKCFLPYQMCTYLQCGSFAASYHLPLGTGKSPFGSNQLHHPEGERYQHRRRLVSYEVQLSSAEVSWHCAGILASG